MGRTSVRMSRRAYHAQDTAAYAAEHVPPNVPLTLAHSAAPGRWEHASDEDRPPVVPGHGARPPPTPSRGAGQCADPAPRSTEEPRHEQRRTELVFRDPSDPRRPAAGPRDRRPRPADLPDDVLRLPRRRRRRRPVRAARTSARSTPASATRPPRSSRTGSRPSRAASARCCVASGQAADDARDPQPGRGRRPHRREPASLYGGTYNLLHHTLPKLGIETTFVSDPHDPQAWRDAVQPNTKAFFAETIPNPRADVLDIDAVADVAHESGVPLIVDNTVATPYLIRPIEFGADIVVHSATKYLGGHGTAIGGVIVDGGDVRLRRSTPSASPVQHRRTRATTAWCSRVTSAWAARSARTSPTSSRPACSCCATSASSISPFNAFLIAQGIETLSLRMERHVANAQRVAEWLEAREDVRAVHYAGLPSSPWHERALKYAPRGAGAVLAFELDGGTEAGQAFVVGARAALQRRQHRRRALARHPPGLHHAQPADRARSRRCPASPPASCGSPSASSTSTTSSPTSTPGSVRRRASEARAVTPRRRPPDAVRGHPDRGGSDGPGAQRHPDLDWSAVSPDPTPRAAGSRRRPRRATRREASALAPRRPCGAPATRRRSPRAPPGATVTTPGRRLFADLGPARPRDRAAGCRRCGSRTRRGGRRRRPVQRGARPARADRRLARHRAGRPGPPDRRLVAASWSAPAGRSTPTGGSWSRPTSSAAARGRPGRRRPRPTAPPGAAVSRT